MCKTKTAQDSIQSIEDGMSIMIGGFLGVGAPLNVIDALVEKGVKNLDVIGVGAGYPGGNFDLGKLSKNRQIKKFITSHIGTNPEFIEQYNSGIMEVEFNPMGTWIERIRAGGAGLGGVLTPTGLGTDIETGREKIQVNGKQYLLYPPLRANIAMIKGHRADKSGNIQYRGTAINTNPVMATAADVVIAEVDEIVDIGQIHPNDVGTPGILVDIIVQGDTIEERTQLFTDLWVKTKRLN